METRWVPVAEGVGLAADTWSAAAGSAAAGTVAGPTGATFLLVHGLASNARMWDGVAATLVAHGHAVVAVDLRGHGRSSKPDSGYDVPGVAADLAALVEELALERPIAAGQSWGGNVVLELAAAHHDLPRGVVLVDGGWLDLTAAFPDWDTCRDALAPPRLAGLRRDAIEAHLRETHPDWPPTGIAGALANFEVRADGTVAPWLTFERHLAVLHGLWDHRPHTRYGSVAAPVLLVPADSGDETRRAHRREAVQAAEAALPVTRTRWFMADHDIHAQRPAELAGAILHQLADGFFG